MKNQLSIPVFSLSLERDSTVKPASVKKKIKSSIKKVIDHIRIDEESISNCLESVEFLMDYAKKNLKTNDFIEVEDISVELGVSSGGKVAFLGTGVDIQLSGKILFKFKAKLDSAENKKERKWA